MKELVNLFKTKIEKKLDNEYIKISEDFAISKHRSVNDEIVYSLFDYISNSSFTIFAGKYDPFEDMKELNNNMKDFKEFFNSAMDEAFEVRKNNELKKIKF